MFTCYKSYISYECTISIFCTRNLHQKFVVGLQVFLHVCHRHNAGRMLTVETISVPAISDGHVIPALTRWTEAADVDRSYAFVLRLFYDTKDTSAGRLYGANRLTIGVY